MGGEEEGEVGRKYERDGPRATTASAENPN